MMYIVPMMLHIVEIIFGVVGMASLVGLMALTMTASQTEFFDRRGTFWLVLLLSIVLSLGLYITQLFVPAIH
ncbi:MAG: hypothetical protein ACYDAG_00430 [Chloroflexota bacterium]